MTYESIALVPSQKAPGVTYSIARMSFGRRMDLARRIRDLAKRIEFLEAGEKPEDKMDASILRAEIDRLYVEWGLKAISGLIVDGAEATPLTLLEHGPEPLVREALQFIRSEIELSEEERKNS